jgi:hypothetical protein
LSKDRWQLFITDSQAASPSAQFIARFKMNHKKTKIGSFDIMGGAEGKKGRGWMTGRGRGFMGTTQTRGSEVSASYLKKIQFFCLFFFSFLNLYNKELLVMVLQLKIFFFHFLPLNV